MKKLIALLLLAALTLRADQTDHEMTGKPSVTFSVTADGTAPFTYQWHKNGVDIAGATNATLVLTNVTPADAGTYTVTVTNSAGSTVSDNGIFHVRDPQSNRGALLGTL